MSQAAVAPPLPAIVTLYEDWQRRRQHLLSMTSPEDEQFRTAQTQILDYLLKQHRNTPEALLPARFVHTKQPMWESASAEHGTFINRRAMLLHHHLSRTSARDSNDGQRVVPIARRVSGRVLEMPLGRGERPLPTDGDGARSYGLAHDALGKTWRAIKEHLQWSGEIFEFYLSRQPPPHPGYTLDDATLDYLCRCAERSSAWAFLATGLLLCADNPRVVEYSVSAWRGRLQRKPADSTLFYLEELLARPDHRQRAAECIRAELANNDATVRERAVKMLARVGSLDDIGLLIDFAALSDSDSREREALLATMRALAGAEGLNLDAATKPPEGVTRRDDWLKRQRRIVSCAGGLRRTYASGEQEIWNRLLQLPENHSAVMQPVRFRMPAEPLADVKALAVFHHLGKTQIPGVRTQQEASQRSAKILGRIASLSPQTSAKVFADTGKIEEAPEPMKEPGYAPSLAQLQVWQRIENELSIPNSRPNCVLILHEIAEALRIGGKLPESAVAYLVTQLAQPDAGLLLARCENAGVLERALVPWRKRLMERRKLRESGGDRSTRLSSPQKDAANTSVPPRGGEGNRSSGRDARTTGAGRIHAVHLQPVMLASWRKLQIADAMRREIASSPSSKVRTQAIRILGRVGTLDDISLLSDLLALPRRQNEDARERPAMLAAMRRLARHIAEKGDESSANLL
ncbi:MAG TPA: hypothetical protein VGP72_11730 [Planctomycetota bacterium]|jgi:hypothetical protein